MQEKHLELIKEKKKDVGGCPAIETLLHRRLQLADEDGDMFAGKIIEVRTGTSKEGVENVALVRVKYDDGETDDPDLAIEDFEWLKETKKKGLHRSRPHEEESSRRMIPIVVVNTLKAMIVIVNTKVGMAPKEGEGGRKALSASIMKRKVLRSNGPLMQ